MAGLTRVLRGPDREFFDLFERAGANILRAADLLERLLRDYPDSGALFEQISTCEHEGDRIVHGIIKRLNQADPAPIERDDILQLSSALDDIVDYIEEVAAYLGLYKIEAPMEQAQRLAQILLASAKEIASAIPLVRAFKDIGAHIVEAHRLENEGDRVVREAIAALFEGGSDPMLVIRWKDIFERLESAIDATERAAHILQGIVIKSG